MYRKHPDFLDKKLKLFALCPKLIRKMFQECPKNQNRHSAGVQKIRKTIAIVFVNNIIPYKREFLNTIVFRHIVIIHITQLTGLGFLVGGK